MAPKQTPDQAPHTVQWDDGVRAHVYTADGAVYDWLPDAEQLSNPDILVVSAAGNVALIANGIAFDMDSVEGDGIPRSHDLNQIIDPTTNAYRLQVGGEMPGVSDDVIDRIVVEHATLDGVKATNQWYGPSPFKTAKQAIQDNYERRHQVAPRQVTRQSASVTSAQQFSDLFRR